MKTLSVVVLVALLSLASPAGGEEKEPGARPLIVTARILRLDVDSLPGLGVPRDEWVTRTGEEFAKWIGRVEAQPGPEARTSRQVDADEPSTKLSVSLLNRVTYIQDFDEEIPAKTEDPEPILGVLSEGVLVDLEATPGPDGTFLLISAQLTVANVIRPIAEFTTTLGGRKVTIQLPELAVKKLTKNVRLPKAGAAIFRAGDLTYLVVTAGRQDAGVGGSPRSGK